MKPFSLKSTIHKAAARALCAAVAAPALALTACDSLIYDDLPPCESGVVLRFVYDYNMEFANAFHSKVDDLTLLVYDSEGRYLATRTEGKEALSDENYRMTLDLPAGTYHLAAYGGIVGSRATFAFEADPSEVAMEKRRLRLIPDTRDPDSGSTATSSDYLRPLYFGAIEVTVPEQSAAGYTYATVPMLKDTNDFRIVLQQVNGETLTSGDFDYEIIDDNILFNYDNSLLPTTGGVVYNPWAKGDRVAGTNAAGQDWGVTYAEFSTSRLIKRTPQESRGMQGIKPGISSVSDPRLRITRSADGSTVLDIPLISYLEIFKSQVHADMPVQEFLDRQSRWSILFFLDSSGSWIETTIEVNGWTVRLNDVEV